MNDENIQDLPDFLEEKLEAEKIYNFRKRIISFLLLTIVYSFIIGIMTVPVVN